VLVLLNFTEQPADLAFSLPEGFNTLTDKPVLQDLLTGESVALEKANAGYKVNVPGYGVRILSAA
jgi:hypothetical protein